MRLLKAEYWKFYTFNVRFNIKVCLKQNNANNMNFNQTYWLKIVINSLPCMGKSQHPLTLPMS